MWFLLRKIYYSLRVWHPTGLGFLYIGFGIFAGVFGTAFIYLLWRWFVLSVTCGDAIAFDINFFYYALVNAHGFIMIFFVVIPILVWGFGHWFIPPLIGNRALVFPFLSFFGFFLLVAAFFIYIFGTFLVIIKISAVPPVAPTIAFTPMWVSLFLVACTSFCNSVNFGNTIFHNREPRLTLGAMSIYLWAIFLTCFLLGLIVLFGLQVLLVQWPSWRLAGMSGISAFHSELFWFFGKTSISVCIIPAFGVVNTIIVRELKLMVYGGRAILFSLGFLGYQVFVMIWFRWHDVVYALHTAAITPSSVAIAAMSICMLIIIYCWFKTLRKRQFVLGTKMCFVLGFMFFITVGSIIGIIAVVSDFFIDLSGISVTAHFHYVIGMGTVFAIFAGLYMCMESGWEFDETLGKTQFWWSFIGANLTFIPLYLLTIDSVTAGALGFDYDYLDSWVGFGSLFFAFSVLLFLYIAYEMLKRPRKPKHKRTH